MGLNTGQFAIRRSLPEKGNKFYNTKSNGGYSTCIQGSPTCPGLNVLNNCVGWACSRFNEVYSLITGYQGMKFPALNCNAENFAERAKSYYGLQVVPYPVLGGIAVWEGLGSLAGHVAFVEDISAAQQFYSSESGWKSSTSMWNSNRTNSNGRYGMSSNYRWIGCIVNPAIGDVHWTNITPNVPRDEYKDQIEVLISDLRVRTGAGTDKSVLGFASKGFYNFYDKADANGYTWYKIADGQWLASNEGWTNVYPGKPKPTPTYKYKIGDKVVINGALYVSSNASNPSGSVSNKVTNITRIAEGAAHPYNTTGDLGWMNEADIKPYEPTPEPPKPTPTELKVGDKVRIVGTGKASSYGDNPTAGGIGWNRYILKIYNGRPYPYQVGNNSGTTGFYKADALQKL